MTKPLRFLPMGLAKAADNIAFTAAMVGLHQEGALEDTLRLYRYHRSVLLGHNQDIESIDHRACHLHGVEMARRMTGGGAVYMAPGVLAWDLIVSRRRLASLEEASQTICGAVAAGLAGLGFEAYFQAPGHIMIGGKKVSGSAGWFEDQTLIHQGTVIVDCDLDELAQMLRLPATEVTTLVDTAGASIEMSDVETALQSAFQAHLGALRFAAASPAELARAKHIGKVEDWIAITPELAGSDAP